MVRSTVKPFFAKKFRQRERERERWRAESAAISIQEIAFKNFYGMGGVSWRQTLHVVEIREMGNLRLMADEEQFFHFRQGMSSTKLKIENALNYRVDIRAFKLF